MLLAAAFHSAGTIRIDIVRRHGGMVMLHAAAGKPARAMLRALQVVQHGGARRPGQGGAKQQDQQDAQGFHTASIRRARAC
jgi:hypothetical protein